MPSSLNIRLWLSFSFIHFLRGASISHTTRRITYRVWLEVPWTLTRIIIHLVTRDNVLKWPVAVRRSISYPFPLSDGSYNHSSGCKGQCPKWPRYCSNVWFRPFPPKRWFVQILTHYLRCCRTTSLAPLYIISHPVQLCTCAFLSNSAFPIFHRWKALLLCYVAFTAILKGADIRKAR